MYPVSACQAHASSKRASLAGGGGGGGLAEIYFPFDGSASGSPPPLGAEDGGRPGFIFDTAGTAPAAVAAGTGLVSDCIVATMTDLGVSFAESEETHADYGIPGDDDEWGLAFFFKFVEVSPVANWRIVLLRNTDTGFFVEYNNNDGVWTEVGGLGSYSTVDPTDGQWHVCRVWRASGESAPFIQVDEETPQEGDSGSVAAEGASKLLVNADYGYAVSAGAEVQIHMDELRVWKGSGAVAAVQAAEYTLPA